MHKRVAHDVYILKTEGGTILETPYNTLLLKKYYDRHSWQPEIIITQQNDENII